MFKKLLLAGGGTGGHVLAAVAVAEAWSRIYEQDSAQILFVGAQGGLESKLIPSRGYRLYLLKIGALNHVQLRRKIKTLLQMPYCFLQCAWILLRFQPHVILGVGGYASGPLILCAYLLKVLKLIRVKIAILEQNAIPGLTNRLLSRFVDIVLTAFPTNAFITHPHVAPIGNPLRASMKPMLEPSLATFGVLIFGGSQGATGINRLMTQAFNDLKESIKFSIRWIHQTGRKDIHWVKQAYQQQGLDARVEEFIDDMTDVYQKTHLVICRAGALTLAELAAIGRAAILIPLPTAANHHQEHNAKLFSDAGAAMLLHEGSTTGYQLAKLIEDLFLHPEKRQLMIQNIRQYDRPDAALKIVQRLSELH